jgi:general secretion pathway protein G
MRTKYGFTLIEVVIVIIIMGLMASFAIPRLTQSREAARLSEGVQILKTYRSAQDRWNLDHAAFTNDCNDLDVTLTPTNFNAPTCVNDGSVSIQRTGGAYTITATAANVYSCAGAGCTAYLNRYLP